MGANRALTLFFIKNNKFNNLYLSKSSQQCEMALRTPTDLPKKLANVSPVGYTRFMEVKPKEVITYLSENGQSPFDEWVDSLKDSRTIAKVNMRLYRASLGNLGDAEPVGEGVYEMRLHFGPGYRIYYGQQQGRIVVLLCGGDKSTQTKDIKRAQLFWADYKRRAK